MNMDEIKRLELIDWDFKRYRQSGINNIHWFPANFIPQIPSILIANLSDTNSVILDPFCGSGTSIVESARLGRKSIGLDINPLAYIISKIKITYIEVDKLNEIFKYFEDTLQKINLNNNNDILIPDFPNQEKWFHQRTLIELGKIFYLIDNIDDLDIKDILYVCFSAILKICCTQRDHYTYIADNMFPKSTKSLIYINAFNQFLIKFRKTIAAIRNFYIDIKKNENNIVAILKNTKVYNEDARFLKLIKDNSIDLIITSPPYANVTDYTKGHRLSFYWLKMGEIIDLKEKEIGARWKRARRTALDDYIHDIEQCFIQFKRVMKKGSFLCFVLGETSSIMKKKELNKELLNILVKKLDFNLLSNKIQRKIYAKRIRAVRGVNKEYIYILRKR